MFPLTAKDPEYPGENGTRNDGRDLVDEWLKSKKVSFGTFTFLLITKSFTYIYVSLCLCLAEF